MMTMVISGSDGVTFPDSTTQNTTDRYGFVNRIINGDMRIDQRNAGAAVTIANDANIYTVDRWQVVESSGCVLSAQQVTDAPSGFVNSHKLTVTTAAGSIGASDVGFFQQRIEGTNVSDLAWGTASAKTITLSFWVKSSITGSFSGAIVNGGNNRSYPFTYSISAANTWEQKSVTIAGDTTGTWLTNNSVGLRLTFDIGSGSSRRGTASTWASANYDGVTGAAEIVTTLNATWYITGVQLEVGSVATPFERRPYGTELALCMRYFQGLTYNSNLETSGMRIVCTGNNGSNPLTGWMFPVPMRASPTMTSYGAGTAGGTFAVYDVGGGSSNQTGFDSVVSGTKGVQVNYTGRANYGTYWIDCSTSANGHGWTASAEL
jgi:hypothetical protein